VQDEQWTNDILIQSLFPSRFLTPWKKAAQKNEGKPQQAQKPNSFYDDVTHYFLISLLSLLALYKASYIHNENPLLSYHLAGIFVMIIGKIE